MCVNNWWTSCKQYRPWSEADFCGVWSVLTLFAQIILYSPKISGACSLHTILVLKWKKSILIHSDEFHQLLVNRKNVHLDQTLRSMESDLGLHCLPRKTCINPKYWDILMPYLKVEPTAGWVADNAGPDQTPRFIASDQGLHCLHRQCPI